MEKGGGGEVAWGRERRIGILWMGFVRGRGRAGAVDVVRRVRFVGWSAAMPTRWMCRSDVQKCGREIVKLSGPGGPVRRRRRMCWMQVGERGDLRWRMVRIM